MVSVLCYLTGCYPYGKLKDGETRLKNNEIEITSQQTRKTKSRLKEELFNTYKQVPNNGLFHLDTRLYYKTDDADDTTKFRNWLRKSVVEPPAIYDPELSELTAESMTFYLQNKGYKDALVQDTSFTKGKNTSAKYIVTPGLQYVVDSIFFNSPDSAIQLLLNDLSATTFLTPGKPISNELFTAESKRITEALQNRGYAYFEQNFIKPRGLPRGNKVVVYYDILVPPEQGFHQKYTIGDIFVDPYYIKAGSLIRERDTVIEEGVHFIFDKDVPRKIKAQNILKSIFIRPGQLYKESNFLKSNRQLRNLAIIKDVNILPKIDPERPDVLDFEIFIYPNKRMSIGGDLELNNSTFNTASTGNTNLIGVATSINYRNRNLFKNAALFTSRAQLGFEFDISSLRQDLLYSRDISVRNDLYFPRLVDMMRTWKLLRAGKVISDKFYNELKDKTKTRLSFNYENISLFNFYNSNSFNTSFGYDLQRDIRNRFQFTQVGINLALVDKKQGFLNIEADNPFLQRSFDNQLFTGFLFRDFDFIHQGKISKRNTSFYFRGNVELSGGEVFLVNKISNAVSGSNKTFRFLNDVSFAQYARIEADFRWYKTYSSQQSFAVRISPGIAFDYGFSDEVPYVKQFFIGGPNSIRAWRIRELGPGEYLDPLTIPNDTTGAVPFFQSGDFLLEMSAEYRFDIIRIFGYTIESALYVDAGNVWTLAYDPDRKGSQLNWSERRDPDNPGVTIGRNLFKQLAVGAGTGIRLDFSYFILRFDAAIKLRNPYPDENGNFWINRDWRKLQFRNFNYNLAVGYPF